MKKIFIHSLIIFTLNITIFAYALDDNSTSIKAMRTEKRVALVIGNGSYKSSPLKNPVNDAIAMAKVLEGLNFEVISGVNLSKDEMMKRVIEFGNKIKNGGVGLFYYAGHGVQVNGQNYLIPINASIDTQEVVEVEAMSADYVLARMDAAKNRLNIVILDACRNNPFARSFRSVENGLAQMKAPKGSFIAYATAPGSVASDGEGKNGLYTQELMYSMQKPGLKIEEMFKDVRSSVQSKSNDKQTPWESSSITGDFYFKIDTDSKISKQAVPTSVITKNNINAEKEYWEKIKISKDVTDFQSFLTEYPNSSFAPVARLSIKQLEKINPSTQQAKVVKVSIPAKRQVTSIDGRYIDSGDGTIIDSQTGLMWTKKDSYADLGKCLDWNDSKSYIRKLVTGGYSDWRMPTVNELNKIYEQSKINSGFDGKFPVHIDPIFASGGAYFYWSSEENDSCCAHAVGFLGGKASPFSRGNCGGGGARAVRVRH
ncbi:MAG: caspase family protein [Nitrospirae bacterium]|nr:caspase family protein [Nitrospirota bacterium]